MPDTVIHAATGQRLICGAFVVFGVLFAVSGLAAPEWPAAVLVGAVGLLFATLAGALLFRADSFERRSNQLPTILQEDRGTAGGDRFDRDPSGSLDVCTANISLADPEWAEEADHDPDPRGLRHASRPGQAGSRG
jgi:hypothetical protein